MQKMQEITHTIRTLVIHVINPRADKEKSVNAGEELEFLINTLGAQIANRVIQKLDNPDNATFIGKGKVMEVTDRVKEKQIDLVILNATAKPRQIHALKEALQKSNPQIEVWDRVDLILNIFDKHAKTTEAKLQIELARMRYMGPRIYGMGFVLSRQGGGIGTSGVGETNTELMKRHWRSEIKKVADQLTKINKNKQLQLDRRKKAGYKTVSIVGYTNAGKSALFNLLTGKNTLVENALFATLDTSVGKIYIPELKNEVLITDTIGFIRNLPPRLIDAFKSTLIESINADLLLHVIDSCDPEINLKIQIVTEILIELKCSTNNIVYIFNKTDKLPEVGKKALMEKYKNLSSLFVSAKTGEGIKEVLKEISNRLVN